MKDIFIIANWKSNFTIKEADTWFEDFSSYEKTYPNKKIVICPPFTLLHFLSEKIKKANLPLFLGAQDISPFEKGAYTGEINGEQIREFADFVIIGHSERRKNFSETKDLINQKLAMAEKYGLLPILCISQIEETNGIKSGKRGLIIAYEPLFAIGSGNPDTPQNAEKVAESIKEKLGNVDTLYGGSVSSENVSSFTKMPSISGVLVGNSSLDPFEFSKIIQNA
jgi:triosephosphate isomerase